LEIRKQGNDELQAGKESQAIKRAGTKKAPKRRF
jgi:hypothetical protein